MNKFSCVIILMHLGLIFALTIAEEENDCTDAGYTYACIEGRCADSKLAVEGLNYACGEGEKCCRITRYNGNKLRPDLARKPSLKKINPSPSFSRKPRLKGKPSLPRQSNLKKTPSLSRQPSLKGQQQQLSKVPVSGDLSKSRWDNVNGGKNLARWRPSVPNVWYFKKNQDTRTRASRQY